MNKRKGKRIYNSGKSIKKKEETPQNLKKSRKCLKNPVFKGFPRIFDPFPCWVVSVLRSFHVTNLFLSDQYIFATCWQIKGDKFYCLCFKYKGIRKSEFMADFLIDSKVQTWNMENSFFTLLQTCIKELYAGFTTISFNMINGSK